jgi:superfamily II DNA/RNA helicase
VHRIGRTGRAGKKGTAISFATPRQKNDIRQIEKLIRKALTISKLPELPTQRQLMTSRPLKDVEGPRRDEREQEAPHHSYRPKKSQWRNRRR